MTNQGPASHGDHPGSGNRLQCRTAVFCFAVLMLSVACGCDGAAAGSDGGNSAPHTLFAQPVFDVQTYGAQGDGSTDDTRAVQAAINAARAAGSGIVYFPRSAGCYIVSGLTFYSHLAYDGEDQDVCIRSTSSRVSLISTPPASPFSNAAISHLTFDGNADTFTGLDCLDLRGPTNVIIDHVTTTHCGEDGVYVTGWGNGSNPSRPGDGLLITNLTSSYNGRNGLSIVAGRNITVRDSAFEHHRISAPFAGVDVEPNTAQQSVENVTFENCVFRDNAYNGFTAWEFNADRPNLNLRLINCTFERNGRDGAYIAASRHVIGNVYVSGRMAANASSEGYRGGLDIWNARNVVVTNLSVTGASHALFIWGTDEVTVANSRLSGLSNDLNTNHSTNVRVYESTSLAHQTRAGSFAVQSGTAPRITTACLGPVTAGSAYVETLAATGDPSIAFARVAGSLPPGVGLSDTGVITGTPTVAGTYTFTIQARNAITYDEKTYVLTVSGPNGTRPPDFSRPIPMPRPVAPPANSRGRRHP